jgi:hypothetical protein
MDLARAPCRARLTARKKGSGYENVSPPELAFQFTYSSMVSTSSPGPFEGLGQDGGQKQNGGNKWPGKGLQVHVTEL